MRILLIAGHGGVPYDPGATAFGLQEAKETRRLVAAVAPKLRSCGVTVDIYDTKSDAFKVVTSGGKLPLKSVDYVLEFHMNAGANDKKGNGKTTGSEIFVHPEERGVSVEQTILKKLEAIGFRNRGVKRTSNFAVLRHVKRRGVSHALLETCFVDDADDIALYQTRFDEIADAIADGVAEGFKFTKKVEEMVENKQILLNGKLYPCECIEKDGCNFVKLRSLEQAGYTVAYDSDRQVPAVTAPQCRAFVPPADAQVQDALNALRTVCGLEPQTLDYLMRYQYGGELVCKLAARARRK